MTMFLQLLTQDTLPSEIDPGAAEVVSRLQVLFESEASTRGYRASGIHDNILVLFVHSNGRGREAIKRILALLGFGANNPTMRIGDGVGELTRQL
jgi:hypothetical protein